MDWSLHVNSAEEVVSLMSASPRAIEDSGSKLAPVVEKTWQLIGEYFGVVAFTHCAYGNEFCEHLIPSAGQLEAIIAATRQQNVSLTLLTPYVTDAGLESLRPLFELLSEEGDAEVVFNDWGVLNLLRSEFSTLKPIQGRLMNKSLRDPRVTGVYAASDAPAPAIISLRRSNLDCSSYTSFLSELGVDSAEVDNLPQGVDLAFAESGIKANAYVPFGFISTSRVCMAAGIHYDKQEKFQPGAPCHHECQTHLLEYAYTNTPFSNRDQKFYLKGNSYFYVHTEEMLRTLFEQARSGLIDRMVFQPRLPMMWERI